jgi:hypothetical protein
VSEQPKATLWLARLISLSLSLSLSCHALTDVTHLIPVTQMASLESWSDVMYSGSDAVAFGEQPIRNYNRPMSLLFILFVMVGCFFMLNLIIGVSIDKVS